MAKLPPELSQDIRKIRAIKAAPPTQQLSRQQIYGEPQLTKKEQFGRYLWGLVPLVGTYEAISLMFGDGVISLDVRPLLVGLGVAVVGLILGYQIDQNREKSLKIEHAHHQLRRKQDEARDLREVLTTKDREERVAEILSERERFAEQRGAEEANRRRDTEQELKGWGKNEARREHDDNRAAEQRGAEGALKQLQSLREVVVPLHAQPTQRANPKTNGPVHP